MKKEEYCKVIDQIKANENIKNDIWENITEKKTSSPKKVSYRKLAWGAAAVVAVCAVCVSAPAVASEIRSVILRANPSYEELEDSIETAVFEKSDGHIKVTVEELLTDGIVADMTVKYTALDEVGKTWLSSFENDAAQEEKYIFSINLKPYMQNTIEYGVNFSYGTIEQKDKATESERVFLVSLENSGRTYTQHQGVFTFPLTETTESVMIDLSGTVEQRSYKLSASDSASEYYTPTYLELSPMSFVIYAKNHGVYERFVDGSYYEEKWLLPDEELDSLEKKSYFIMKDGSKVALMYGAHNTTYAKSENMYSDVMLYSGRFYDIQESGFPKPKLMNLDDFEAVVINGVRFEFEE